MSTDTGGFSEALEGWFARTGSSLLSILAGMTSNGIGPERRVDLGRMSGEWLAQHSATDNDSLS